MEKKIIIYGILVIAILGGAVWGIGRIAQANKTEKEQAKVEKSEASSGKGLFYYFSCDANLERFIVKLNNKLVKAQTEYQEAVQNLDKAKQSGDLIQVMKCKVKLQYAEKNLASAQADYNNVEEFYFNFAIYILGHLFLDVLLIICGYYLFAFCRGKDKSEKPDPGSFFSKLFSGMGIVSLVFGLFMSWISLLTLFLVLFNVFFLWKRRKIIAEEIRKAEEKANSRGYDDGTWYI